MIFKKPYVIFHTVEFDSTEGGDSLTDTKKLQGYIDRSGLKQKFIAESIGLSSYGFARKRDNLSEFLPSEIDTLCNILNINTVEERFAVFFAKQVEGKST